MNRINLKVLDNINFALVFYKLMPFIEFNVYFKLKNKEFSENITIYEKIFGNIIDKISEKYDLTEGEKKDIRKALDSKFSNVEILSNLLKQVNNRNSLSKTFAKKVIQEYTDNDFKTISLRTGYRLIIGMGIPSFFENGLTLHHIYGIPYIPASSVKGLARFVYILTKFVNDFDLEKAENILKKLEAKEIKDFKFLEKNFAEINNNEEDKENLFVYIFGSQNSKGRVVFGDAFPERFKYVVDIMNPHFSNYYNEQERKKKGKDVIGEWQNPIPIPFLAIEDAKFVFPFKVESIENQKLIEKVIEDCLKEALKFLGIGAKTRKGYGWFEEVES